MRVGLVFAALALAWGPGPASSAASTPPTRLEIVLYPKGPDAGLVRRYRLSCAPTAGTVPMPGRACRTLARLDDPFAPVPRGMLCTQIALGPQQAVVTGLVRGRRVAARLRVQNGCEIERWRRVADVVPGFPR